MVRLSRLRLPVLCALAVLGLPAQGQAVFIVRSIGGSNAASITPTVNQFRADLGNPDNLNAPGTIGGRREINWDGGGATNRADAGTPFNGFLNNRGAQFITPAPGTGFTQSPITNLGAGGLTDINPTYATTFSFFSPMRVFTPLGNNITDVFFFIPGTGGAESATVSGFGAVFSDVDLANTTRLQFFDFFGNEIFNQTVTPGTVANGSLSFLGASGNAGEQIFRVRITTGNSALGPTDGGAVDVVVLDDLFYAEPLAVPEPASLTLAAIAAVTLGGYGWRRRRQRAA